MSNQPTEPVDVSLTAIVVTHVAVFALGAAIGGALMGLLLR
jgi:hypothetical protein